MTHNLTVTATILNRNTRETLREEVVTVESPNNLPLPEADPMQTLLLLLTGREPKAAPDMLDPAEDTLVGNALGIPDNTTDILWVYDPTKVIRTESDHAA